MVRVVLACLLLSACTTGDGHPLRGAATRLSTSPVPAAGQPDDPAPLDSAGLEALVFQGLERLDTDMLAASTNKPGHLELEVLADLERAILKRWSRGGPAGAVRHVSVLLATAFVPLPPTAYADLVVDPDVERAVLAAASTRPLPGQFRYQGHSRAGMWIEKRNVGAGPFQRSLLFGVNFERLDLPDGRVLIRQDGALQPRPQHVTLYRGLMRIDPRPEGAYVRELLVFGTDISIPGPLSPLLRSLVEKTLKDRATNLVKRAYQTAGISYPQRPARRR